MVSTQGDDLLAGLRERIDQSELSLRAAATQIGISPASLLRIMRGDQEPSRDTLAALAKWLGTSLPEETRAIQAHLRAEKNLHPDVAGALARMFHLVEQRPWPPLEPVERSVQAGRPHSSYSPLSGYIRQVENLARSIRRIWGPADPDEPFEPYELAKALGLHVAGPTDVLDSEHPDCHILLDVYSDRWSAGTVSLPTGVRVVVLNPNHDERRKRITLMEEICHVLFDHEPTSLREYKAAGQTFRDYDKEQEKEAYWVGAAVLVPYEPLARDIRGRVPVAIIAQRYRVSEELVKFRIKVTGQWSQFTHR